MKNLKGTERQIKWANDIKKELNEITDDLLEKSNFLVNHDPEDPSHEEVDPILKNFDTYIKHINRIINELDNAWDIIDTARCITNKTSYKVGGRIVQLHSRKESIKRLIKTMTYRDMIKKFDNYENIIDFLYKVKLK